jgi:hypothetical protein
VNDKKRIVASGIRDTSGDPLDGIGLALFKEMVEYVAAVGPEYGNMSHWMDGPALEAETESSMFSPSGQVVLTETDWTQESRGFDFTLQRTYRSGSFEMNNPLGPNWYHNHDRFIVHDTFNDQLYIHDGTGQVVTMEKVQDAVIGPGGRPIAGPTYVAINSSITDVAVFRSQAFAADWEITRDNPVIGAYEPGDVNANRDTCTGANHAGAQQSFFHSEGFSVHDSAGNVAFYRHSQIIDIHGSGNEGTVKFGTYGNQKLRTKGGELRYYKLAYIKDANGNRQNYYYGHVQTFQAERTGGPDELLWCVVDTEGRGNYFWHMYIYQQKSAVTSWAALGRCNPGSNV